MVQWRFREARIAALSRWTSLLREAPVASSKAQWERHSPDWTLLGRDSGFPSQKRRRAGCHPSVSPSAYEYRQTFRATTCSSRGIVVPEARTLQACELPQALWTLQEMPHGHASSHYRPSFHSGGTRKISRIWTVRPHQMASNAPSLHRFPAQ
jgi:hypothetical protein